MHRSRFNDSKRGGSRYEPHKNVYKPYQRGNKRSRDWNQNRSKRPRIEKEKKKLLPVFSSSGLLELESNNKDGVPLKHVEPADAMSPEKFYNNTSDPIQYKCILYSKDSKDPIKEFALNGKSCYLVGRKDEEDDIADISIQEETCSQQHCVIQFRRKNDKLVPFLIDLESSNGTTLNGTRVPPARYVELKTGDVIKFTVEKRDSIYELVFVYI